MIEVGGGRFLIGFLNPAVPTDFSALSQSLGYRILFVSAEVLSNGWSETKMARLKGKLHVQETQISVL